MSDKEKNKDKRGVLEFISQKFGVTADEIAGGMTLELRGRNLLLISGCRRIEKYSPCLMTIRVRKDLMHIRGKRLICSSYHSGKISVEGVIDSIGFEAEEGK